MPGAAFLELDVSGSVEGVYLLLRDLRRAVLIKRDSAIGLRPLPVKVPAGKRSLFIRMRDGRWAAGSLDLKAGVTSRWKPLFR